MKEDVRYTKSQKRLLGYLSAVDPRRIAGQTISEFASEAGVSDATVLRFCRALGYKGYSEFRLALAGEGAPLPVASDYVRETERDFRIAAEGCGRGTAKADLDRAVSMLLMAEEVCCFGAGGDGAAARLLECRLLSLGRRAFFERDGHLVNLRLAFRRPEVLLVVFDGGGRSKDGCDAAGLAHASGAGVLAVTCAEESPLSKFSDLTLSASIGETSPSRQEAALVFFAEALSLGVGRETPNAEQLSAAAALALAAKRI